MVAPGPAGSMAQVKLGPSTSPAMSAAGSLTSAPHTSSPHMPQEVTKFFALLLSAHQYTFGLPPSAAMMNLPPAITGAPPPVETLMGVTLAMTRMGGTPVESSVTLAAWKVAGAQGAAGVKPGASQPGCSSEALYVSPSKRCWNTMGEGAQAQPGPEAMTVSLPPACSIVRRRKPA